VKILISIGFGLLFCLFAGCWRANEREVVVYAALDAEFSEPLLEEYGRENDVVVRGNYDVESTKTVGMVTRIIRESRRPRCDVFWNNEILHTLRLQKQGLLEPYISATGKLLPANYRSDTGAWYGFAARARILILNKDMIGADERPDSILDLADPRWKGRAGIAKPLFGTTATHASVLFGTWGTERSKDFFRKLKENVRVMGGNKQVAQAVSTGALAFGLTDTDDALIEIEAGYPVEIVYPDQQEGGLGTLFIPNTLCIIKGGPNPQEARALVDYLLSEQIEEKLAQGPSAQFPVNPNVATRSRAASDTPVRWMDVDFESAADHWDEASEFLQNLFATGE
jgi:iron(III) transport system substrate-binding protein